MYYVKLFHSLVINIVTDKGKQNSRNHTSMKNTESVQNKLLCSYINNQFKTFHVLSLTFIFSSFSVGPNILNTLHFRRTTVLSFGLVCASQVRLAAHIYKKMLPTTHNAQSVRFTCSSWGEFRINSLTHDNQPLENAPETDHLPEHTVPRAKRHQGSLQTELKAACVKSDQLFLKCFVVYSTIITRLKDRGIYLVSFWCSLLCSTFYTFIIQVRVYLSFFYAVVVWQ